MQSSCQTIDVSLKNFKQLPPCTILDAFFQSQFFSLFLLGLPTGVKNCTYSNQTQISVEIHCVAGYDGGLPQYFVLELISAQTGRVR